MDPGETGRYQDILLDYFSTLPESVIHHILSFLSFKYIVRTGVLSKRWNHIWSNYPNIDLVINEKVDTNLRYGCPLLVHIQMILNQCLFRKACIQKMCICIVNHHLAKIQPIMDQCLRAAIERSVSELVIEIRCYSSSLLYSIPGEVVVGDSLKVLQLEGCMLEDHNTFMDLPHLHKLILYMCGFSSENVLPKILSSCPRLEFLEVSYCDGVCSSLSLSCKLRLKYLRIRCGECDRQPKKIEIFAPGLETFDCMLLIPCSIDLAGCTALKRLELHGAILSADYVPIQHLLRKYIYIEELKLSRCQGVDKIQVSSSCLKGLVINNHGILHGVEISTPNLISLENICIHEGSSNYNFCSWKVPKVEKVHMMFSFKNFQSACRSGLKGFLMKLQNYEDLKLLVGCLRADEGDFIMHEKLHAVSFSSLNKLLKKVKPTFVIISCRRDESFLADMVVLGNGPKNLCLISSSRRNIELVHMKLSNVEKLKCFYNELKVVSMEEIEHEMDSAYKSFMKTHSNGYHTARIIFTERG